MNSDKHCGESERAGPSSEAAPPIILQTASGAKKTRTSGSSSSSSSDSTSSSGSTSNSTSRKKRSRRHRRRNKKGKRSHRNCHQLDKLSRQVSDLRKQVEFFDNNGNCGIVSPMLQDNITIDDNVSGILYQRDDCESETNSQLRFNFGVQTKLKESAVPKAPESMLKILQDIQYFEKTEWSEVRYAEVQKLYNHTPGFVELEANEEIKAYDSLRHLTYADKAYAALTFCVLKQRESLQSCLQELLLWSRDQSNMCIEGMHEKLTELFSKGEYAKISADLLQLVCGHRAEVIQMRRDGITNMVRDPLTKSALKKVPPSNRYLFSPEAFTSAIEKAGGIKKSFLPLKSINGPAPQAGTSMTTRHPSQGSAYFHGPSQGPHTRYCTYASNHTTHQNFQPSQGTYNNHNRPTQGYGQNSSDRRTVLKHHSRGTFRGRGGQQGGKPSDQIKSNRKRHGVATDHGISKKRRY